MDTIFDESDVQLGLGIHSMLDGAFNQGYFRVPAAGVVACLEAVVVFASDTSRAPTRLRAVEFVQQKLDVMMDNYRSSIEAGSCVGAKPSGFYRVFTVNKADLPRVMDGATWLRAPLVAVLHGAHRNKLAADRREVVGLGRSAAIYYAIRNGRAGHELDSLDMVSALFAELRNRLDRAEDQGFERNYLDEGVTAPEGTA